MLITVRLQNHSLTAGHFDQCAGFELLLCCYKLVVLEAAKLLGDKTTGCVEGIAGVIIGRISGSGFCIAAVQGVKQQNSAVRAGDVCSDDDRVIDRRAVGVSCLDAAAVDHAADSQLGVRNRDRIAVSGTCIVNQSAVQFGTGVGTALDKHGVFRGVALVGTAARNINVVCDLNINQLNLV